MTWRVGRKLGRTLYRQLNPDVPDFCDDFMGLMDTREMAAYVVLCVNSMEELGVTLESMPDIEPLSVDPDDACGSVMPVDSKDRVHALPEHDGAVPAVPADADLPVIELHPGGDDTGTRDT